MEISTCPTLVYPCCTHCIMKFYFVPFIACSGRGGQGGVVLQEVRDISCAVHNAHDFGRHPTHNRDILLGNICLQRLSGHVEPLKKQYAGVHPVLRVFSRASSSASSAANTCSPGIPSPRSSCASPSAILEDREHIIAPCPEGLSYVPLNRVE